MLDLSGSGLQAQIQANMMAYMRLFAGLPGMYMRDDQVFWFVSNRPAPGDCILKAHWPEDDQLEARIDRLFAEVGQHLQRIDWLLFPSDQPASLGSRLEARGMPGSPGGNWLGADLSTQPLNEVRAGFEVERVRDDRGVADWLSLSEQGFEEELDCYYDAYARHGYGPRAASSHYIGHQDGVPVTSATLLDAGGTAAIYDLSTPPEQRRQGFGAAITLALLQEIRQRGYAQTWIWSSNRARSLYKKLGFHDADFGIREHTWKK